MSKLQLKRISSETIDTTLKKAMDAATSHGYACTGPKEIGFYFPKHKLQGIEGGKYDTMVCIGKDWFRYYWVEPLGTTHGEEFFVDRVHPYGVSFSRFVTYPRTEERHQNFINFIKARKWASQRNITDIIRKQEEIRLYIETFHGADSELMLDFTNKAKRSPQRGKIQLKTKTQRPQLKIREETQKPTRLKLKTKTVIKHTLKRREK